MSDEDRNKASEDHSVYGADTLFRDLADNLPGAVFRYVLNADGTDFIEYMSDGCLAIWEVDATVLKNDPTVLWGMILPEDLPDMQMSVMSSAQNLTHWTHTWRIRTPSGSLKWLEGRGQPRRLEDGGTLWNSMILDITDRMEAQAAISERDRGLAMLRRQIASASKASALGALTASIAHEVNQPFAALVNYLHAAKNLHKPATADDPVSGILGDALDQADRASNIVKRVRSLFEQGDIELVPNDVNVLVEEAVVAAEGGAAHHVTVVRDYAENLPQCPLDRLEIQQVLVNLIRNSFEALDGSDEASVLVRTRNLNDFVEVRISDNGPGIDAAIVDDLFEPFSTTKPGGTGLGLSISRSIIEAHNGTLTLDLNHSPGAAFVIALPADLS